MFKRVALGPWPRGAVQVRVGFELETDRGEQQVQLWPEHVEQQVVHHVPKDHNGSEQDHD